MLIVEYNRAACAATQPQGAPHPRQSSPEFEQTLGQYGPISPILSNWLNQITPPNPDMSINV